MALSTGQVNDAYQAALGRMPSGSELSQYTSDNSLDGDPGKNSLISSLKSSASGGSSGSAGNVQSALSAYQGVVANIASKYNQPTLSDSEIMSQVKSALIPSTPAPEVPNLVQSYATLRGDPSVTGLEKKLSDLKQQQNLIKTTTRMTQATEEGKPVAMNVISGRQTEEQRMADIQLSSLSDQITAVTSELTMRYTMIDNIMQFTQTDYANAVKSYETQLAVNRSVFDAFNTIKSQQDEKMFQQSQLMLTAAGQNVEFAQKQEAQEWQEKQDTIRNASSNLTMFANMISSGQIKYNDLSADQKLSIQKLEVQAGLGTGFIEHLTSENPNGKVIYAGANGAVMQMPDGSLKTVNYNVSGSSGGSSSEKLKDSLGKIGTYLNNNKNSYGNVSPQVWQTALTAWQNDGLSSSTFISQFSNLTDPNRGDFAAKYGFNPSQRGGVNTTSVSTDAAKGSGGLNF